MCVCGELWAREGAKDTEKRFGDHDRLQVVGGEEVDRVDMVEKGTVWLVEEGVSEMSEREDRERNGGG